MSASALPAKSPPTSRISDPAGLLARLKRRLWPPPNPEGGWLERWCYRRLSRRIEQLAGQKVTPPSHWVATAIAFAISVALACIVVAFELWLLPDGLFAPPSLWNVAVYMVLATLVSIFELYLLILFGLSVSARLVVASASYPGFDARIGRALARAVAGVREPEERPLELDAAKYTLRRRLLIFALLWRGRRLVSKFVARQLLRRVLVNSALRSYSAYVAAPITGFWGAWVVHVGLGEVRFRIAGRLLADAVLKRLQRGSERELELAAALLLLVGHRLVRYGEYNVNLDHLITALHGHATAAGHKPETLDDWAAFCTAWARLPERERATVRHIAVLLFACKRQTLNAGERACLADLGVGPDEIRAVRADIRAMALDRLIAELTVEPAPKLGQVA